MTAVRHQTPQTVVDFLTPLHRTRKLSGSCLGGEEIRPRRYFLSLPQVMRTLKVHIPEAMIHGPIRHPALHSLTHRQCL